jgi:hypothetical protein
VGQGQPFLIAPKAFMDNPWAKLPIQPPFVLNEDLNAVLSFNESAEKEHKIHFEVLPQPYAGNPKTAKVYLLNLNPGFDENDEFYQNNLKSFKSANFDSLTFKNNIGFYFLDDRFRETPAYKWWYKILGGVIKEWGIEKTIEGIMCLELFGYHSVNYKQMKKNIPSQEYSFYLLKEAIKSNKTIISMRSLNLWLEAVPELHDYPYIKLKNKQRPWISPKNLPDGEFDRIFGKP